MSGSHRHVRAGRGIAVTGRAQSTLALARRQRRIAIAATIRVGGTLVAAVGIALGVRILGADQFGVSVLTLAVGAIAGLPLIALERLVIRLAATHQVRRSAQVMRLCNYYCWALAAITVVMVGAAATHSSDWAWFVASSGVSAVMSGLIVVRQGLNRAAGRLLWGQAPNEVFRPAITIVGYVVSEAMFPAHLSGSVATLLASALTLIVVLFAPTNLTVPSSDEQIEAPGNTRRLLVLAMTGLVVIAAVAAAIERLYPLLVGALSSNQEVAALAIAARVIQLGLFGQAFAIFILSPPLAAAMRPERVDIAAAQRMTRIVRVVGLLSSAPIVVVCAAFPGIIERAVGGELPVADLLRVTVVAIIVQSLNGPTQTLLVMAGEGGSVARAYVASYVVGLGVFLAVGSGSALAALLGMTTTYVIWTLVMISRTRRLYGKFL